MWRLVVSVAALIGCTLCQNFDQIRNYFPNLTTIEGEIREKCIKNEEGEDAFEILRVQPMELNSCLEPHLNFTQVQEEISEAKKTGSLDDVFHKYCQKYPEIYRCVQDMIHKLNQCLHPAERVTLTDLSNLVPVLKEYMCFNDGIRMSMFISQGGVECTKSKSEELQECLNQTLGARFSGIQDLPGIHFSEEECKDLFKLRICVYKVLTKCKQNIPANVLDAFFKFLKKYFSCKTSHEEYLRLHENSSNDGYTRLAVVLVFLTIIGIMIYILAR